MSLLPPWIVRVNIILEMILGEYLVPRFVEFFGSLRLYYYI
jgi:hypothetical protein